MYLKMSLQLMVIRTTTPGFAMKRSDAEEIGVTYASRLDGRYTAARILVVLLKMES